MLIVIYQYRKYGSLKAKFTTSTSSCKGIKINACIDGQIPKSNNEISRYQLENNNFFELNTVLVNEYLVFYQYKEIFVNISNKNCFVMQVYSNQYMIDDSRSRTTFSPGQFCEVSIQVQYTENYKQIDLKKFRISGFLDFSGSMYDYGEYNYDSSNYNEYFNYRIFSGKYNATYFKRPKDGHFQLNMYQWSDSWTNFIISHMSKMPRKRNIFTQALQIPHFTKYLTNIMKGSEFVLIMTIITNRTFFVQLKAETEGNYDFAKPHFLQWDTLYKVIGNSTLTVIVALPGQLRFLGMISNTSVKAMVRYRWMQVTESMNDEIFYTQKYTVININATGYHIIKEAHKGDYHFSKFYKNHCFLSTDKIPYYLISRICKFDLFSWKEASNTCKQLGGHLPHFFSREEQEELLHILKTSTDLYLIEAMFIEITTSLQSMR